MVDSASFSRVSDWVAVENEAESTIQQLNNELAQVQEELAELRRRSSFKRQRGALLDERVLKPLQDSERYKLLSSISVLEEQLAASQADTNGLSEKYQELLLDFNMNKATVKQLTEANKKLTDQLNERLPRHSLSSDKENLQSVLPRIGEKGFRPAQLHRHDEVGRDSPCATQ